MSDKLKRLFIPGIMDALLPTVEWVQELLGGKVDKVTGKGLSTNDYTTADKQKLAGIEAGAQKNSVLSVNGKTGVVNLDASDVNALPSNTPIPAAVTEQTVAGWGFTKNTGDYSKPSGGIPKSDLAQAVQTSLGKADTALQSHQSLAAYRTASAQDTIDEAQDTAIAAKYTKPSTGIPKTDLASAAQTSLGKADTALQDGTNITNNLGFCYVNVGAGQTETALVGTNANYVPKNGGIVVGRFLVDVPANATINISGKGAKAVYFRNSAITAGVIKSGDVAAFVYYPERYYLIAIDRWQTDIDVIQNAGYQTAQDVQDSIEDYTAGLEERIAAFEGFPLVKTYTAESAQSGAFILPFDRPLKAMRVLIEGVSNGDVSSKNSATMTAGVGKNAYNRNKKIFYGQIISNAAFTVFVDTKLDKEMDKWISDGALGTVAASNGYLNTRQLDIVDADKASDGVNIYNIRIVNGTDASGVSVTTGTTIKVYGLEA